MASPNENPFEIVDPRFQRYTLPIVWLEQLHTGLRWAEGPAYFADLRCLIWSDLPNNRMMRWEEETGAVSVFRVPSNFSNGNTRDREGRLVTCEHQARRVHAPSMTADYRDRRGFDGKRLNSPNDVVVKSDGTIWFTDPRYGISAEYEGGKAESEIGSCTSTASIRAAARSVSSSTISAGRMASPFRPTNRSSTSPIPVSGPTRVSPTTSGLFVSPRTTRCTTARAGGGVARHPGRLPRRRRRQYLDERRRWRALFHTGG